METLLQYPQKYFGFSHLTQSVMETHDPSIWSNTDLFLNVIKKSNKTTESRNILDDLSS